MKINPVQLAVSCLIISFHLLAAASPEEDHRGKLLAPALYILGDSLVDSGNNNLLPTLAKANFKPYGVTFCRGPTGRFTNGRTVADFIAEFLGLPYPPPYMDLRGLLPATGMNYASGSCGILYETGKVIGKCLALGDQINLFEQTVTTGLPILYQHNQKQLSEYLAKSLFVVAIGSNDYINNYLQPHLYASSTLYSPQAFAQHLIDSLSQKLQRLHELGARKVLVFGIGPVGCIPSIAKAQEHNGKCVEEVNRMVTLYNDKLGPMLKNLTASLPGSNFILGNIYMFSYSSIQIPTTIGLTDSRNPCCITWANGTSACVPRLEPCTNMDKRFFWDGFHLTEAVYKIVASDCINNSSVCWPTSLKDLVKI
ncbi:GDSL esterase/lipase 7-like [Diospyros lotus]|uniref:GDSL esterase/lipase 7-like n=1 Tax=Diospyros lotus TaxID=55363 RepID=UPI0022558A9C|nr:GDSL esterase/lipase 7-like [Diospyros lotus]